MDNEYVSIFPDKAIVYASFYRRFTAFMIDLGIVLIPALSIHLWLHSSLVARLIVNILIGWLYDAIQNSGPYQGTIGKRIMQIKITDLIGDRIAFGRATARHFSKTISMLSLFGFFMMLWDRRCQDLHDKIAGTLVVMS